MPIRDTLLNINNDFLKIIYNFISSSNMSKFSNYFTFTSASITTNKNTAVGLFDRIQEQSAYSLI